jgi:hypothetical protein
MNAALSYFKIRFRVDGASPSEMVIPAMSSGDARKIFTSMMPGADIISVIRIAGPGMNNRTPRD